MPFTASFAWGAATAAYQIEGAWNLDGKGESNWDRRAHTPDQIRGGGTGDVAVDHYHRWPGDVALLRGLGVNAYRLSIAWSRVQPDGRGALNPAGLAFYERLFDALLTAGIEPFVTLCHYDSPQALHDAHGGWRGRDMAFRFADYAGAMARRYGDRVRRWITLNEPLCVEDFHHGPMAPADRVAAIHHLLLGHGAALAAIRAVDPRLQVGLVNCLWPIEPYAGTREADHGGTLVRASAGAVETLALTPDNLAEAVRQADGEINRLMLDPLWKGAYPEDAVRDLPAPLPIRAGDMELIGAPCDFFGLNYYSRIVVKPALRAGRRTFVCVSGDELGVPVTTMGWEIRPQALRGVVDRLWREYRVPCIYLTENGMALDDIIAPDGTIADPERIAFLQAHLGVAAEALGEGAPLAGYFVWSLLDNFEWSCGWGQRFGLFHVDYQTLERRPKASAHWYRNFIQRHRPPPQ